MRKRYGLASISIISIAARIIGQGFFDVDIRQAH